MTAEVGRYVTDPDPPLGVGVVAMTHGGGPGVQFGPAAMFGVVGAPVELWDAVQGVEKTGMDAGPGPIGVEGTAVIVNGGAGVAAFAQDLAQVAQRVRIGGH